MFCVNEWLLPCTGAMIACVFIHEMEHACIPILAAFANSRSRTFTHADGQAHSIAHGKEEPNCSSMHLMRTTSRAERARYTHTHTHTHTHVPTPNSREASTALIDPRLKLVSVMPCCCTLRHKTRFLSRTTTTGKLRRHLHPRVHRGYRRHGRAQDPLPTWAL